MKFASIVLVVTMFLHAYVYSQLFLYILTAISATCVILLCILPLSAILNNWFFQKRGLAVGFAFMGSGIGGMIFSALAGRLLVSVGWRSTYQIFSLITFLTIVPLVFFVIRIHPKELNLRPFGYIAEVLQDSEEEDSKPVKGMMLSEALGTFRFWAISISVTIIMISGTGLMMNIAPHLIDVGYSVPFTSNIVALSMASLAVGKLVLGFLFDKFGLRATSTISSFVLLLGCISILYSESYFALGVVVLGAGFGGAFFTIAPPIITTSVFGNKDFSSIFGILNSAISLGGVISPIFIGALYDSSGSYISSFKILIVLAIISIIVYQFVFPKSTR